MVASVSRLPQKASETPGAVTVIDQEMIRASGFRTVEDLLRLVPGFQVTSHNQDPAIAVYHGLNTGMNSDEYGPRMQVLIDGRSQYSPLFKSGVNWNLLPVALENIERIEVIRGSNTVSYGSNAFLGVINIITFDASQTPGWMVSANHGSNHIRDETLRWGGKVGNADVRFTYHALGDNGFQKAYLSNQWVDSADDRRTQAFDVRADLPLTNQDELQITASQVEDRSLYGRFDRPTTDPVRYLNQKSTSFGLLWHHINGADEERKLRYNFTEDSASGPYNYNYSFANLSGGTTVLNGLLVDPGGKSRTHEIEFESSFTLNPALRAVWGSGLKSIVLTSPYQFSTNAWLSRHSLRGFGNLEYRPAKDWLFNLGTSLEHDSKSGYLFDPRASASYHLTADQTVRLVISRAHRTPSLYEIQGRTQFAAVGTTNPVDIKYLGQGVDPERIDSIEIGYLGDFKALRASIDLRAFRERIPNHIQIVPLALPAGIPDDAEPNVARYYANSNTFFPFGRADGAINLENVVIQGVEYQLRWQPFEGTRLLYNNALVNINAAYTHEEAIADAKGDTTDKIIRQTRDSAPTHSQSAMLIQQLPWDFKTSILYFRAGAMRWRRNSTNGLPLEASERFDWRLAKTFKFDNGRRAEVAYTVQMANEAQAGRQYAARFAEKLQWLTVRLDF